MSCRKFEGTWWVPATFRVATWILKDLYPRMTWIHRSGLPRVFPRVYLWVPASDPDSCPALGSFMGIESGAMAGQYTWVPQARFPGISLGPCHSTAIHDCGTAASRSLTIASKNFEQYEWSTGQKQTFTVYDFQTASAASPTIFAPREESQWKPDWFR